MADRVRPVGLAGVLSLEDALELLVGEIEDEFDQEMTANITQIGDGWLVPGHLGIRRLERLFEMEIPTPDGVDSVGGLVASLLDEPQPGDTAASGDLRIKINEVEDGRATRLQVTLDSDRGDE